MKILAFDCSTEILSVGLAVDDAHWQKNSEGGAKASQTLISELQKLLKDTHLTWQHLDLIAFGQGPGSFTGLRTACSVAQGLAFASKLPLLPLNTLLILAESARLEQNCTRVLSTLDARMGQIYAATYEYKMLPDSNDFQWFETTSCRLYEPKELQVPPDFALVGNASLVYPELIQNQNQSFLSIENTPNAKAMLSLASQKWLLNQAVSPELALPLYVRDKVAQTTEERHLEKLRNHAKSP